MTRREVALQAVKRHMQRVRLYYLAQGDIIRFSRHASLSSYDHGYEQVVARIMYNVHALEKGLARVADRRLGFGQRALTQLNGALRIYRSRSFDVSGYAYVQGLSVIRKYVELHKEMNYDISFLRKLIDDEFLQPGTCRSACCAGTKIVHKSDKVHNAKKGFYELAQGRSSVREFSGKPIDTHKVLNALRNAEKTPSVCNRQGWRAYWVEDKELAADVLAHQRGFGYPIAPEVLLMITVSNNSFLSPVERNQGFVDGGLFAMSVIYGLEAEGLGAVPLNACLYSRDQRAVRTLLSVDPSEVIVMFIAVGDLQDETLVPTSGRRPVDSFIRRRER